jgi:multidrug resistance protein, MATE family
MFTNISTTYRQILNISLPLIVGTLGYNIIAATDTLFIGRAGDKVALAAIGLVAPFYLVVTLIGLSFSRGGQILIARKSGSADFAAVGTIAQSMFYFQLLLAAIFYVVLKFFGYPILDLFIEQEAVLQASYDYVYYRIDGVFFGFGGLTGIGLYSGLARTKIIIYNTVILATVNIFFDYVLVFGYWGFPELGIKGAAIGSVLAELAGIIAFLLYARLDKHSESYGLFRFSSIDWDLVRLQLRISTPIAMQSAVGLLSGFIFFSFIEKLGTEALAISSAVRVVYVLFGVAAWGMGSAASTVVSQLIGEGKTDEVFGTTAKFALVSVIITIPPALLLLFAPSYIMSYVTNDPEIITTAGDLLPMIFWVEVVVAIYTIYYNSIIGTGAMRSSLLINFLGAVAYLVYVYYMVSAGENLYWVWSGEFVFAVVVFTSSLLYLKSNRWKQLVI